MTTRIGIALSERAMRVVAVRHRQILWCAEMALDARELPEEGLGQLLATTRFRRPPRPRAVAVVGPARSQLRRLRGLPAVGGPRLLDRVVAEGSARFFLRGTVPLTVSRVMPDGDGSAWAAAVEEPAVTSLQRACRAAGLRLLGVAPVAAALPLALASNRACWRDGESEVQLAWSDGRVTKARRRTRGSENLETALEFREVPHLAPDAGLPAANAASIVPELARLGDGGWRYADAYGAALLDAEVPLLVRTSDAGTPGGCPGRWRVRVAATALGVALVSSVVAPGLADSHAAARAEAHLHAIARSRQAASRADDTLEKVTGALAEVAAFDSARHSMLDLLSGLTAVLPTGSAMVMFRVDGSDATLVVLSPRAAALVPRIERVPAVASARLVGPVTRERSNGRDIERATLKLQLAPRAMTEAAAVVHAP